MCLYSTKQSNLTFQESVKTEYIIAYKVVRISPVGLLSFYRDYLWQAGINKADKVEILYNFFKNYPNEVNQVNNGIHVFLERQDAINFSNSMFYTQSFPLALVEVYCNMKNFVAAGSDDAFLVFNQPYANQACFSEVELTEKEIEKFYKRKI